MFLHKSIPHPQRKINMKETHELQSNMILKRVEECPCFVRMCHVWSTVPEPDHFEGIICVQRLQSVLKESICSKWLSLPDQMHLIWACFRLCHQNFGIQLVVSYLSNHWTDLSQTCIKMKVFVLATTYHEMLLQLHWFMPKFDLLCHLSQVFLIWACVFNSGQHVEMML